MPNTMYINIFDECEANRWTFDPFRAANLLISLSLLAPLPPESRGDVATLTRFLTNAVGEKAGLGLYIKYMYIYVYNIFYTYL